MIKAGKAISDVGRLSESASDPVRRVGDPAYRKKGDGGRFSRAGHAMIFLIMTLVILVFVVLWAFDVHEVLYGKARTQNGGDAAAVAAARWQGISLNLIGDLNLIHALDLMTASNSAAAAAITNIQARLSFTGPLVGLMAAQQAAKNNGVYANASFTQYMRQHIDTVRSSYGRPDANGNTLLDEPYDGAWNDYANMLESINADGIAAGPDNAHMYTDYSGSHPLLTVDFYEAIAGRTWCWFYIYAPGLLDSYRNYTSWDPLPEVPYGGQMNSEIFGLGLTKQVTSLGRLGAYGGADDMVRSRYGQALAPEVMRMEAAWYCYSAIWTNWESLSQQGERPFPSAGPVKQPYDYAGADAVVRIESVIERVSPGSHDGGQTNTVIWTAAAKAFGSLNGTQRPDLYGLVLPVYTDARLIPVDASSVPSGGSFNVDWQRHIQEHLPDYMRHGPGDSACWYCAQLRTWELEGFRRSGSEWLEVHGGQCQNYPSGGPGGGRRTGH